MSDSIAKRFPITRKLIRELQAAVDHMATQLPAPARVPPKGTPFQWRHAAETVEVVQLGKAVRIASGLSAARLLADGGYCVESGVVLRTVADFSAESMFLSVGQLGDKVPAAQAKFVADYFTPIAKTPDDLAAQGKQTYVRRTVIQEAVRALAKNADLPVDEIAKIGAFTTKILDAAVHGAYESAMELYSGATRKFMLVGSESTRTQCAAGVEIAMRLLEALYAVQLAAVIRGDQALYGRLRTACIELQASGEHLTTYCA